MALPATVALGVASLVVEALLNKTVALGVVSLAVEALLNTTVAPGAASWAAVIGAAFVVLATVVQLRHSAQSAAAASVQHPPDQTQSKSEVRARRTQ